MNKIGKIALVVALVAIVAAVVVMKQTGTKPAVEKVKSDEGAAAQAVQPTAGLPRLVDLGSKSCIPCKMMAPILEDLTKEYAGRLAVEFIDVNENRDAARQYGIKLIPTQIFFDASGKEVWRHEGFISKEDILARWKELGVALAPAGAVAAADPATVKTVLVSEAYPGLASGCLTYARLADLPQGTLLEAGDLVLTEKDVAGEVAQADPEMQPQLRKNGFFVLEQVAGPKLLVRAAKAEAARTGKELSSQADQLIIDDHLGSLAEKVEVADAEVADFYQKNKDTFGGAALDQVQPEIRKYLLRQKQQEVIATYVAKIGQRMPIEVSAGWVKEQAALAKDNPVDKARAGGRPLLVDFGASGCRPCEMMTPILEDLQKKYAGKVNVLFVHVGAEQVLAARYGIAAIPVQVFFDKDGKEVFRHVGFFPQDEIEKQLAEMGVR